MSQNGVFARTLAKPKLAYGLSHAARAGARKVYAVEASAMAANTRAIVAASYQAPKFAPLLIHLVARRSLCLRLLLLDKVDLPSLRLQFKVPLEAQVEVERRPRVL